MFLQISLSAHNNVFSTKELYSNVKDSYNDDNDYLAVLDNPKTETYPKTDITIKKHQKHVQNKRMLQYAWMIITGIAILLLWIWIKEKTKY